nr:voltage-dependent P/Q-type calcium channel subunit alpha-1A-like [Anolis sagrei ordinatus]
MFISVIRCAWLCCHGEGRAQGSSSVSGSPVLSTSGTSTPRRGRRQLPQTPSTPRPHVSYSPVVRKGPLGAGTAAQLQQQQQQQQQAAQLQQLQQQQAPPPPPSGRTGSPSARRYPAEPHHHHHHHAHAAHHHAPPGVSERRSRSPALERHTVPPRNDSPRRAYRHASSRWSAPHVPAAEPHAGPRHGGGGGSGGGGYYRSPDYAGEDAFPYEHGGGGGGGGGGGRAPRTSRAAGGGGGGGGGGGSPSVSPSRHGRRLPNGYYPSHHGPAKARGSGASRKGLHEPSYSETDEDDCC